MSWVDPIVPAPDTGEEELLQPREFGPRLGLGVAATVGFAALALVLVLHRGQGTTGHRPLPSPVPASASPDRPALVALPAGPGCPVGATCSEAVQLPVDTVAALYAVLPDVAVVRSVSVLANRPGHFQPDLLSRRVDGEFDGGQIVLRVVRTSGPAVIRIGPAAQVQSTPLGVVATARQPGFVVTIVAHGGTAAARDRLHQAVTLSHLRRLAGDAALVEPQ